MNSEWNLEVMYKGLEDPAYAADVKKLEEAAAALHEVIVKAPETAEKERTEAILSAMENMHLMLEKTGLYVGLRQAVEAENGQLMAELNKLMMIEASAASDLTAAKQYLGAIRAVDALAENSAIIGAYKALILDAKEECAHLLPSEVEAMVSAMDMTGGGAWGRLQSFLTSTVKVDYKGGQVTLSEIRNLAYSANAEERAAAYEAELKAYNKIRDGIAFALNNIKNQVTMLSDKRGYASPLEMTLKQSKMTRETLDAMLSAIRDYLPAFRKYLRKKGEMLGSTNGLKFYDLFAPLGAADKIYSLEEARETLVTVFNEFTPELGGMMAEAFDNEWIDFYPRNGKEGGAFCAGASWIRESRILTNYDGTFGAVDTLAHELGHAFHNLQTQDERPLNMEYAMPVAETASTFNEVFLGAYALKNAASREERLSLLESDLREKTQCVVDIYSRYLFESAVFEQAQERFLMPDDLCDLMLDAQNKAYGNGLDPDFRHPYMWACKSHYYGSDLSFYNFPYAFGNLFAQGLYALYLKEGDAFVPKYKEMLRTTGVHTIEEDGAMLGIDLTRKEFWEESLKSIAAEIEEFCAL